MPINMARFAVSYLHWPMHLRSLIRSIVREALDPDISGAFNADPWIYGGGAHGQHARMSWQVVRTDPLENGPYRTAAYYYEEEQKALESARKFVAQFGPENVSTPTLTLRTAIGKVDPYMEDVAILRARGELQ